MSGQSIGAHLDASGCHFSVWAPHADQVHLLLQTGDSWLAETPPVAVLMQRAPTGYWTRHVPDARAGNLYRYRIKQGLNTFERLDPAARDVFHSGLTRHDPDSINASIIVDPSFSWSPFRTPAFENFIIYQVHLGSFSGRNDGLNRKIGTFKDMTSKLSYIRDLGFNTVEFLPVEEFAWNRSWGYNPAFFFAPESAYGSPDDLRRLVDSAHQTGLAVLFDVVYNHAGPGDNVLWAFDGYDQDGGIYMEGGQMTPWGVGPAWDKKEVQEFFYENAKMYLKEYNADGLRFDATRYINGAHLKDLLTRLEESFPDKYMSAEHLPSSPWITKDGKFDASWYAKAHHETQRALVGESPVTKIKSILGWDGFDHSWNLVKYTLGSHDDIGDAEQGDAEHGTTNWDARHRYFVDQFGGRHDWEARAKCRLGWALNAAMPGTPLIFMGSECHMGAPHVGWGYWHDGEDARGDHRFDWSIAGDSIGLEMRRLVTAANQARWNHPALRSDTLIICHEDHTNHVIAFKRWTTSEVILTVVNLGNKTYGGHDYGVATDWQFGQWTQILCTQDATFGGWDGAGNAFYEPATQEDGKVYISLPKLSVLMFALKS